MIMKLSLSDLRVVTGELKVFYSSFGDFFRNRTRSVLKQAFQYLQGQIMLNERVNKTNIEKFFRIAITRRFSISSPICNAMVRGKSY